MFSKWSKTHWNEKSTTHWNEKSTCSVDIVWECEGPEGPRSILKMKIVKELCGKEYEICGNPGINPQPYEQIQ